jgi:hypothetical protein
LHETCCNCGCDDEACFHKQILLYKVNYQHSGVIA